MALRGSLDTGTVTGYERRQFFPVHALQHLEPVAGIRITQKRHPLVEDDIAGKQHPIGADVHRQVAIGMGGSEQGDDELHIAKAKARAFAQVLVGGNQVRVFIHPGRQRVAAFLESLRGLIRVEVFVRSVRGENLGIQVGEHLQSIDMIGVVVAHHDPDNGFIGDAANLLQQQSG